MNERLSQGLKRFARARAHLLASALLLACSSLVRAQDIDLVNCTPPPPTFTVTAPIGANLDVRVRVLNNPSAQAYWSFDPTPTAAAGPACTGQSPAFRCNGVDIKLPASEDTPVPSAAVVTVSGVPVSPASYSFGLRVAQDGGAGASCQRLYQLQLVPETQPPTMPSDLKATPLSNTRIGLTWAASTDNVGVARYEIERKLGTQIVMRGATATSFEDSGLMPSTTYTYRVRAVDAANNFSAYSQPVPATTQAGAVVAPNPPTNVGVQ